MAGHAPSEEQRQTEASRLNLLYSSFGGAIKGSDIQRIMQDPNVQTSVQGFGLKFSEGTRLFEVDPAFAFDAPAIDATGGGIEGQPGGDDQAQPITTATREQPLADVGLARTGIQRNLEDLVRQAVQDVTGQDVPLDQDLVRSIIGTQRRGALEQEQDLLADIREQLAAIGGAQSGAAARAQEETSERVAQQFGRQAVGVITARERQIAEVPEQRAELALRLARTLPPEVIFHQQLDLQQVEFDLRRALSDTRTEGGGGDFGFFATLGTAVGYYFGGSAGGAAGATIGSALD